MRGRQRGLETLARHAIPFTPYKRSTALDCCIPWLPSRSRRSLSRTVIRCSSTNSMESGESGSCQPKDAPDTTFYDHKNHHLADEMPSGVRRFRMTVQYDGTNFSGFQRQAFQGKLLVGSNGKPIPAPRTVQECLEKALEQICSHRPLNVFVAGRTDKGVHSSGNVISCDMDWFAYPSRIPLAMNRLLPDDVAVVSAEPVPYAFHPRHSASFRRYEYTIFNHKIRSPFFAKSAWHVPEALDVEAMRQAASFLVGAHDFTTFGRPLRPDGHCVREVMQIEIRQASPCLLIVDLKARAWLYHMVRSIVGTLRHVGAGIISPEDVRRKLLARSRHESKALAPAHGLSLVEIGYWGEDGGVSWGAWAAERRLSEGEGSIRLERDVNGEQRHKHDGGGGGGE